MRLVPRTVAVFRTLFRRSALDRELDVELQCALDLMI
jgi:hypothetical protein